jgi:hypothetical protein
MFLRIFGALPGKMRRQAEQKCCGEFLFVVPLRGLVGDDVVDILDREAA